MSHFRALLFQFYKTTLLWNLTIDAVALYAIQIGGPGNMGNTIFIKIIGYIAAVSFQYYFYPYTYFYYRNAGYSVKRLYIFSFAADFLLYLLVASTYIFTLTHPHAKS